MAKNNDAMKIDKIPAICAFCIKKGIPGPHDHMVRDFGKKGSPICCPELLKNVCDNCTAICPECSVDAIVENDHSDIDYYNWHNEGWGPTHNPFTLYIPD